MYGQEKLDYEKVISGKQDITSAKLAAFLKADIDFVDSVMTYMEQHHGTYARLLVWLLYVQNMTVDGVAKQYHMPKTQIRADVDRWMHELFDDDKFLK